MEVVVYTHSDYSDVWKLAFPNLLKNIRDFKIHLCINSSYDGELPESFIVHRYDESQPWGRRVESCIRDIESKYILYLHEDWIPIDILYPSIVGECIDFMERYKCEYLMSYASRFKLKHGGVVSTSTNGFVFHPVQHHFMQPAIWNASMFRGFCLMGKPIHLNEDGDSARYTGSRNCYGVLNTKTIAFESSKAFLCPHIHAVNRGKWTCVKYPMLYHMLTYYGIDVSKRGVDRDWIVDTQ